MATEKRLIDANALLLSIRTTLVQCKYKYDKNPILSDLLDGFDELVMGKVKNALTVNAVEVVRCKNCKHWRWSENNMFGEDFGTCVECLMDTQQDHFCSYGERKEGE